MPTLTYPNIGKLPIKPTLQDLFRYGEGGAAYAFPDMSAWSQDAAGTVPVTAIGQQVYRVADISGRSNHQVQATANFRPRAARAPAGGVRNLLLYTEEMHGAGWNERSITRADLGGGVVAITETTGTDAHQLRSQTTPGIAFAAGATYTFEVEAKLGVGTRGLRFATGNSGIINPIAVFDLVVGSVVAGSGATITALGDGWYRCTLSAVAGTTGTTFMTYGLAVGTNGTYAGDGSSSILLRKPQAELGNVFTAYQKVTDPWDVTEAGKKDCYCLYGDGVDDTMATAASVFPVRNGMSLVSAFAIAGIGPTAGNTPIFGANLSTTSFTISARRSAATVRQLSGFVRNSAGAYTWTTNAGNAGFDFGRPVVAAVTQDADVMSVLSENPTSDRVASAPLGSTVSAAVPIGVSQAANNGPVRWHGGIIIDRPLTDLERAFAMEHFGYLSGAIE